jgi:hypothetical protein
MATTNEARIVLWLMGGKSLGFMGVLGMLVATKADCGALSVASAPAELRLACAIQGAK